MDEEFASLFNEASVIGENDWITVSHDFRTITIPANKSLLGVTSDERVNVLHFRLPRYYGDVDLSEFTFRINYLNAMKEGDIYAVTDAAADENYITFSWTVGRHACTYSGSIRFVICARTFKPNTDPPVVDREYNTTVATMNVIEGLEVDDEAIILDNYDLIEQFLLNLQKGEHIEEWASDAEAYALGTRDGTDVESTDPAYHNNSKYFAQQAGASSTSAATEALKAEGWATGNQNGSPVGSGTYYQNNAKYYRDQTQSMQTRIDQLMLSGMTVVEDSSSTSVTLAAEAETRYIYGTLSSLTVSSLPSTGLVDIVFISGSTPTTVTLPNGASIPEWVDLSDLDANTKYEFNFADGNGVVMSWPATV